MDQNQYSQQSGNTPYPQENQQGYMPPPPSQQPLYSPYAPIASTPLSVGQYILMFVIMAIPIANIIMLFVWAFGDANPNKKNFARACLILFLISIVLAIIISITLGSIFSALFMEFNNLVPSGY